MRGGLNQAKPGYRVGPRQIECYSIHFVKKGAVQFEYDDEEVLLQAGDAFCLYPKHKYTYFKRNEDPDLHMRWLAFDGPGAAEILSCIGFSPQMPFVRHAWTMAIEKMLINILKKMKYDPQSEVLSALEMQGLLQPFFAELIKATARTKRSISTDWVQQSIQYIELHATEGISVQHVARVMGFNRAYFSGEFTKKTGNTPLQYITRIRMTKARQMLSDPAVSITEIAYSLGYPNVYAFSRAFKHYYGTSPTAFRSGRGGQR